MQRPRVRAGGPLRVVREPPPTTDVTADNLTAVAKKCCRPASLGGKFRASPAAQTLREMAKHGRDAHAWKTYLAQLRDEKNKWKGDTIERASSD